MLSAFPPSKSIALFEESIQKSKEYNEPIFKRKNNSFSNTTVVITGQSQNCAICSTPVYPAEKISIDSLSLHPACFRCHHCSQLLSFSNSEKVDERFFCKAHYKIYSSGEEKIKNNPFMANARCLNLFPLAIKTEEAVGKSVSGKKAAYQSLVDVSSHHIDKKFDDPECIALSPEEESPQKNFSRLERSRSMFLPSGSNKENGNKSFKVGDESSISRIVRNRLRLYEKPEDSTISKPNIEQRVSMDPKAPIVSESMPTSQTNNISVLSPNVSSRFDTSLAAASKTNLRSRIQSYQGKWSTATMGKSNSLSDIAEEDNTGTITRTFKNVVESLINYGRQNNTEIKIRENLSRHRSIRVGSSNKTSPITYHSSIINAEGLVSHRHSVTDVHLKVIFDQVTKLEPSITIQDNILNQIQAVDQKLMDQDATIEKLQNQIAQLKSMNA